MKRRQVLVSGTLLFLAGCMDSDGDDSSPSFSENPSKEELEKNFHIISVDEDFEVSNVSVEYETPEMVISLTISNVSENPAIADMLVQITDTEHRIAQSFTRETEPIPASEEINYEIQYKIDPSLWERIQSFSFELTSREVESKQDQDL